jgi:hypothetical protein
MIFKHNFRKIFNHNLHYLAPALFYLEFHLITQNFIDFLKILSDLIQRT